MDPIRCFQKKMRLQNLAVTACWLLATIVIQGADTIWIEGEKPTRKMVSHHGWYDDVDKSGMSGGAWLSHYDARKAGTADYEFTVTHADDYMFWWRGNVLLVNVSYTLDDQKEQVIDFRGEKREEMMISPRPDHRSLGWVKVGKLQLSPGKHQLRFRFHSAISNHGGLDCFCLTRVPFVPSGARQPMTNDKPSGPADWFPVVFDDDIFSPQSVIDVSRLIEAPAGKYGFLQRDGNNLRFAKAPQPIRFWGVGGNITPELPREQQIQRIRYWRKHGVNMVRQHPLFSDLGPLRQGKLDARKLDQWDWWFARLKEHGLYMTWSVFYPLRISAADGYDLFDELPKEGGLASTSGFVNIERHLQDLQRDYIQALLHHRNPYTGLRYVDDPALAVLEIHNEDCIFWHWPLNVLAEKKFPRHAARLRQKWHDWVKNKYRDEAGVRRAWGGLRPGETLAQGELELMAAWQMAGDGPRPNPREKARAGDFVAFLTGLQRDYFARREKELREMGYRAVTVTTAWKAGGAMADPANLYCDTACDMIDRHNYFGGGIGGHGISTGKVNNSSQLARPGAGLLAIGLYQVEDRPFACTEWTSLPPNEWKLEAAPLIAFYGMGLQGWDASYHFTSSRPRPGEGWPNLNSYVTDTPHYIGQFPALAFAIHHGHVREAPIIAARRLQPQELFHGRDVLRQDLTAGHDMKEMTNQEGTPAAALAVGRVTVGFDGGKTELGGLEDYWNTKKQQIHSATHELFWDYRRQVVLINTERTQGIVGRAANETISLRDVVVKSRTPFVSLLFTPLDNLPLADSRQILITALARDKQTGTRYSEDGQQLLAIGGPPLLLEPVQADVRFKSNPPQSVQALDIYGVPTGKKLPIQENTFTLHGGYRTYYYEVRR